MSWTGKRCKTCLGSGRNHEETGRCDACAGTGEEYILTREDREQADAMLALRQKEEKGQ